MNSPENSKNFRVFVCAVQWIWFCVEKNVASLMPWLVLILCERRTLREYCILSAKPACMEPPSDETMMVVRCGSQCGGVCVFVTLLLQGCDAMLEFFLKTTLSLWKENVSW